MPEKETKKLKSRSNSNKRNWRLVK